MFIVKTSARAFLLALLPLVLVHGVLFAMALASSQTEPPMIAVPSPDRALGMLALRVAVDGAGLILGHFVARSLGFGSRAAYALIGGMASVAGYAIALQHGLALLPPGDGTTVTAGILPMLAGMTAGFLYGQFAGREPIAAGIAQPATSDVAAPVQDAPAPVVTPSKPSAVFDGPVQVRSSVAAMALASLVPAMLATVFFFGVSYTLFSGIQESPEPMRFNWSRQILAIAMPAQMFLTTTLITALPGVLFVALAHGMARALRWTRGMQYAGAGALMGLAIGVSLIPFGGMPAYPFTGVGFLPLTILGAIMMAVYRRFAGLEPRSLPEPVLARELEALVPEDHPARHQHAVVLNG